MTRYLFRCLAALVLAGACFVPAALAQRFEAKDYRGVGLTSDSAEESRTPALPYAIAIAYTLVVLVIVCTPSRKQQSDR